MTQPPIQIERIKQALSELRANRTHFSTPAYGQLVMLLLNELRRANTITPPPATTTDEVRVVTVMFVDVVGSTKIAESMDASDWKTLIGEWHSRIASLVTQWDGQIGQYLGDGLLCFFGAQRSRGDDALRSVSCALSVVSAMRQYSSDVFLRFGIDFMARISISTGRVVVGLIGSDTKQELLALGSATNLASRLQGLAAAGEIVIDATTYSRVRNQIVTQAQPAVHLKGFDRPIKYYKVLGRSTRATREFTSITLSGMPLQFAGREAEIRQLRDVLDKSLEQRRFHAVTMVGDIGIGKSRLLQEFMVTIVEMPITTLVMIASYEKRNTPYHLLRDWLTIACDIMEDTPADVIHDHIRSYILDTWDHPDAETAAAVIGYLAGFGFEEHPEVAIIQQNRRERAKSTLEWVGRWLRALGENNGLLIAVDNLQWADSASIRLLDYVAQELADVPIMLLSAARPIYRSAHPMYLRDNLSHSIISLEPITVMATTRVIDAVLSQVERVPDALKQLIIERAEGNPLFVQEFLGMLFDTGVFYQHTSGIWRFNIIQYDSAAAALPHGLMGVLQARLDDLSPEARQIIQIAAVVGQVFWESAVAHLTEMNPHPLLETLVLRGMIMRQEESQFDGEIQYTFRHTLYRDVAYEIIPRARREAFHKEVARWFVSRVADKPEFYPSLAEQYEAAGQHELALATCLEAVQNRLSRALLTEALILTDRGLGLARNVPREVALPIVSQLWTLRAQTLNALGRYDEASAASQSALMLLREMPSDRLPQMRVLASRMLAHSYSSVGRYDEAYETLLQAQQILPKGDAENEVRLLQSFASLSLYQGRIEESLAYLQRGVELGRGTGEYALNSTYTTLGIVLLERGSIAEALVHFERVLANNNQRQYRHYMVADLRNIGWLYTSLLAYDRAMTVFNEAAAIAQSIGQEDYLLQAYRGACYMALGRRTEGLALIMDALRHGEKEAYNERMLFLTYIRALAWAGDMANCREQALVFIQHVRDQHPLLYGRGLLWLGVASTALGEKTALAVLQDALRLEIAHGGQCLWLCYEALANATRDPEQRQEYYSLAAEAVQRIGDGLHTHPDLQYTFLMHPYVQGILASSGQAT